MRSMYWQLGILGTISAFAFRHRETKKKTCVDMAGHRTFRILTSSQQSGVMKLVTTKFKSGGLHKKHVVATWNLGNHLSICF